MVAVRHFASRVLTPQRRAPVSRGESMAGLVLLVLGVAAVCVVAGYAVVSMGDISAQRPAFFVVLPLVIAMAFTLALQPKALVIAIILLRAGADPVFQNTRLSGMGGLGGMVNLAVIGLAFIFVLRDRTRVPRGVWLAWLPFLAVLSIGLVYSPDLVPSIRLFLNQLSIFAMFILAFYLVDDFKSLDKVLRLVVTSSLLVVAVTAVAIARGQTASSLEGLETVSGRYSAPFPHPNILAFYLVLVIGVVLYLWKRKRSTATWPTKAACMLYVLVLLAALYATKTRSAWLAAAFLFLVYGFFVERRYLLYLLAAPALAMLIPEFRDRIMDLGEGNAAVHYAKLNSFAWRQLIWTSGLAWMEAPRYLMGYGYNSFAFHSIVFFPLAGNIHWGAHSVLVQLFFEFGVLGIFSFVWLFWCGFRLLWPAYRSDQLLVIVFGSALSTYLIVSLSDNMLDYTVFNWYFWFSIGAACAAVQSRPAIGEESARSGFYAMRPAA